MEIDDHYATRKTVAQGLLDVALLTTNATQLRFILSLDNHEFYNLVLTLIIISILLQVNQYIISYTVGRKNWVLQT